MSTVASSSKLPIKVEMTSDAICPFCFIGYQNLNKAISLTQSSPIDVSLEFKPFLLDPTLTNQPAVKRERYAQKFGGKERVAAMEKQMVARGKEVGINFSYGGTVSQTHDYHRLMSLAHNQGSEPLQRRLAESFFHGYFEQEQDPGQRPYLIKTSLEVGLFPDEAAATKFLDSEELMDKVEEGYREAKALGISGVPFFVFDGKYAVSGAQPPEVLVQVFEQIVRERGGEIEALGKGEACAIDDPTCAA